MTNLATKADLEDFTQSTVSDDQALLLLTACSTAVRNWCHQFISLVEDEQVTLRGNDKADINLPEAPAIDVSEVLELAPGEEDVDGDTLVEDDEFYFTTGGVLRRIDGGTFLGGYRYKVTYTHGYAAIPADVILAVCRLASKLMANPTASGPVQSESIGDYSYTLASATSAASASLTDEKALLAPYRTKGLA